MPSTANSSFLHLKRHLSRSARAWRRCLASGWSPIGDQPLARQRRQALADLERCLFSCKKLELAVDGIRLTSPAASTVTSVALQMMSFLFVGQLDVKNVL